MRSHQQLTIGCSLIVVSCILHSVIALGQNPYKEVEVNNGATVTGLVVLDGTLPKPSKFEVTKDPQHCGVAKASDRLLCGQKKGVKNVIVSLEGITEGKKFASYVKPVVDQRKCEYVPHIQILPVGTALEIINSDNILHNVHAYSGENNSRTVFNIAQPIKGQKTSIKQSQLSKSGLLYLTCDAGHPWMTGYVLLAEHPYYSLTDLNGKFELTEVPPGTYKLRIWKEGFRVVDTEMEKGKVKKYHFEDPYEEVKEITIQPKEKVYVEFQLVPRS